MLHHFSVKILPCSGGHATAKYPWIVLYSKEIMLIPMMTLVSIYAKQSLITKYREFSEQCSLSNMLFLPMHFVSAVLHFFQWGDL